MAVERKVISEYINQVIKGIPGSCIHKKGEYITRCYDCQYISVPRLETEPIFCNFHNMETAINGFCCWAKRKPYPVEYRRGEKFLTVC